MGTDADVEEVVKIPIVRPKKATPALPAPRTTPMPVIIPERVPEREPVVINR